MGSKLKHNAEEAIRNFSSYNLSTTEKSLLCKGLDFVLCHLKLLNLKTTFFRLSYYLESSENFESLQFELLFRNVCKSSEKTEFLKLENLKSKIKDVGLSLYRVYNKKNHRYLQKNIVFL